MPRQKIDRTVFMNDLFMKLMDREKNRYRKDGTRYVTSASTAMKYIDYLKLINKGPFEDLVFLDDTSSVCAMISNYAISTQRNMLASIVTILNMFKDDGRYDSIAVFYGDKLLETIDKYKVCHRDNVRTERQKKNWVDIDEVNKVFNGLYDRFMSVRDLTRLCSTDYNNLLALVILSLYTLIPPRRSSDYIFMYLTDGTHRNAPDKNFLNVNNWILVFNTYKTSKTYGEQVQVLDESKNAKILDILRGYLKFHPILKKGTYRKLEDVRFLVSKSGNRLYCPNINTILQRVFKKRVGPSLLRAIYTTYVLSPELEKINEAAKSMGTSYDKLSRVYNKIE